MGSNETPLVWREVLDSTENWIKYEQAWPVNEKQNAAKGKVGAGKEEQQDVSRDQSPEEQDWKRKDGVKDANHGALPHGVDGP